MKKTSLETYYSTVKENIRIWSTFAKACDLSHAECDVLFMLYEGHSTQAEICEQLFITKQTVNSAVKKLMDKGIIILEADEANLRSKKIRLTKYGSRFIKDNIEAMDIAEKKVWASMSDDDKEALIKSSQVYNRLLDEKLQDFLTKKQIHQRIKS